MLNFKKFYLSLIITLYILLNLVTLTRFPLMHSDESWLSGLSRHISITGDYSETEPFFDIKPRHPHALKVIFHSLQILMIKAFGYTLFNMRLLSLVFGLATLYCFYRLCLIVLPSKKWALWACLLMGIDIQFIYHSHFGRQEIMLLWVMVFGLYYYFKNLTNHLSRRDLIIGVLAGLSIGIHPNSLIVTLMFCAIYMTHIVQKRMRLRSLLVFSLAFTCFVLFFVKFSYRLDPNFLANYFAYGEEQFKVLDSFPAKLNRLVGFAKDIYLRQGGTYYLPDLKMQFFLLTTTILLGLAATWRNLSADRKKPIPSWLIISVIATIAGLVIIGRYNTTSFVFLIPFVYLMTGFSLVKLPQKFHKTAPIFLFSILLLTTAQNIYPFLKYDYQDYLKKVTMATGPDRKVLASLNVEYGFKDRRLIDLRNLSFLKRQGLTFAEYLRKNRIEYIIYPEGLDFIYQTRPRWNGVYGHLPYYLEMQQFLRDKCRLVSSFIDPAYGIEIPAYVGKKKWQISIYRVLYNDYSSTSSN